MLPSSRDGQEYNFIISFAIFSHKNEYDHDLFTARRTSLQKTAEMGADEQTDLEKTGGVGAAGWNQSQRIGGCGGLARRLLETQFRYHGVALFTTPRQSPEGENRAVSGFCGGGSFFNKDVLAESGFVTSS